MATYSNISGTTSTSFKIGANGVLLQSEAISGGEYPGKYLLTNQTHDSRALRIAYEFDDEAPNYLKFDRVVLKPNESTDSAIALFDGSTGSILKDSGRVISSTINANSNNIPTIGAVIGYVGELSQALQQRLAGTL